MIDRLVVVLFLTSLLAANDVVSNLKVFCRKKDGNHVPIDSATYRQLKTAKRDVTGPAPPPPVFVEFTIGCEANLRKECPGVDNMCTAWRDPLAVDAHFKAAETDPILNGGFCSLVGFDEMKCAATQAELGVQPMSEQELCKGVQAKCPIVSPPPTPAPTPPPPPPPPPQTGTRKRLKSDLEICLPVECLMLKQLPKCDVDSVPQYGQRCHLIHDQCYDLRLIYPDCQIQVKTLSGGAKLCVAQRPKRAQCEDKPPKDGTACEQIVEKMLNCLKICMSLPPICLPTTEVTENGKILCIIESLHSKHIDSHSSHQTKLSEHIKGKSYPSISPLIYHPQENANKQKQVVMVLPLAARITEVNEKEQAISVMLLVYLTWTDHRLAWNSSDFGGIDTVNVARDSIWRPPLTPLNLLSFSNDDALKPNVKVQSNGVVSDTTVWNFRISVNMQFKSFPFDRQTFYISLKSYSGLKLEGTRYILSSTESESEWQIMEDFEKVSTDPDELTYKVTIKRYPYFWINLIIRPCFILGFLVIAALTLGADSNSIEALVNIGLAASVSSAVVVSTMTDHFPKTENVPSLANFVQNQFFIMVAVLIFLSSRKMLMPRITAAIEEWQKVDNNRRNEVPMQMKIRILVVKIVIHRMFAFFVFGAVYSVCFIVMMRHLDLNFERKQREDWLFTDVPLQQNFLSPHQGQ